MMLTKEEMKRMSAIDEAVNGIWALPPTAKNITYRVRDLHKYCESRGVGPRDLTASELKQFEVQREPQPKKADVMRQVKQVKRYVAATKAL
ncbi:hypothetical protein EV210_12326 [Anaerospora hongkongensis]|uniref:Uncharacterized protein n=1 Tax=Anaerospora hongkongensis TaxID=244830 RepID=A0A4R1PLV1_9FIRM|nr:hypothetical protein [Anaerospora hongkongensis]TCL32206.1 hypothetical protein EV210_12326 [Anaerospora hongkongensis]